MTEENIGTNTSYTLFVQEKYSVFTPPLVPHTAYVTARVENR